MTTDPTAQLITSISDDPEVREAAKLLALDSIRALRAVLRRGSPALQLQVASRMLPAVAKALAEDRSDANEDLRQELNKLNSDVAEALGVTPDA